MIERRLTKKVREIWRAMCVDDPMECFPTGYMLDALDDLAAADREIESLRGMQCELGKLRLVQAAARTVMQRYVDCMKEATGEARLPNAFSELETAMRLFVGWENEHEQLREDSATS